eukprot:TRINITY_DN1380_c0_g1_i1.p1 TRINITY_DN1380_c0_g1~~TRINITY_DN1380_c0_g1_i1.p1  ORF type:complete len:824 (-),score=144.93 TRINITY_DN1380_c0_g1_i1:408-2879(-)
MCPPSYLDECPVLHGAAFPMLATDTFGTIVAWNVACTRLFKYKQHEAIGMNIKELIASDDVRSKHDMFVSDYVNGKPSNVVGLPGSSSLGKQRHMRARRKDGRILAVMAGISDVRCQRGQDGKMAVRAVDPDDEPDSSEDEDASDDKTGKAAAGGSEEQELSCPVRSARRAGCPYRRQVGKASSSSEGLANDERFFLACFADLTEPERVKNALLVACYDAQCTVTSNKTGEGLTVSESSPQLDERFGRPLAGLDPRSLCASASEGERLRKFFDDAHAQNVSVTTIDFRCNRREGEQIERMDVHCVQLLLSPGSVLLAFGAMKANEGAEVNGYGSQQCMTIDSLDNFTEDSEEEALTHATHHDDHAPPVPHGLSGFSAWQNCWVPDGRRSETSSAKGGTCSDSVRESRRRSNGSLSQNSGIALMTGRPSDFHTSSEDADEFDQMSMAPSVALLKAMTPQSSLSSFPGHPWRPMDQVGSGLNSYKKVREVGRGGQATVWEALDRGQHTVALKVIPLPGMLKRRDFPKHLHNADREVRSLKRLAWASAVIVKLVDCWLESDFLSACIIMEWLPCCLQQVIIECLDKETGPPPVEDTRKWFAQVAAATAAIHHEGFLHRDIKPGNILMTVDRKYAKLADFGISREVHKKVSRSSQPQLLPRSDSNDDATSQLSGYTMGQGTLSYVSPEAMIGRRYDTATDMFSLGCVLLEMLTLVMRKDFPDPHSSAPGLPTVEDCVNRIFQAPDVASRIERCPVTQQLVGICKETLQQEPSERPGAAKLCSHEILKPVVQELLSMSPALKRINGSNNKFSPLERRVQYSVQSSSGE